MKLVSFIAFSVLGVQTTFAQQDSSITLSGFIDSYYSYNGNRPSSQTNKLHSLDVPENQINLNLAEVVLQKKITPVGFRLDFDFGTANDILNGIPPYGTAPYSTLTNLQQAYLTAVLPLGNGITIDAGKFVSHMGYEVVESKDNWNYSRSLLFAWAVPTYHTGIRIASTLTENFTATIHVLNGWNSVVDNNDKKTLGLTLNYTPDALDALTINAIDGVEEADPVIAGKKTVFDFIFARQLTDRDSLVLNADYGEERTVAGLAIWKGIAVYGRHVVGTKCAISLRAEILDDPIGYATGLNVPHLDVTEVTWTLEYRFARALLLRGEGRFDFSNAPIFDKKSSTDMEAGQATILVGAVVMF